MTRTLGLVAALLMAGAVLAPQASFAASPPSQSATVYGHDAVEKVGYRHHCRKWRHICRQRWDFGWGFRRCMRRHGC